MTQDYLLPLYLAGPISGLTYEQANSDRGTWEAGQEFKLAGWTGINPLEGYEALSNSGPLDVWFEDDVPGSTPEQAVHADLRMIDSSAAVFANYSQGAHPSLGTAAEIGYAFAQNKPIITLLPEGEKFNRHPFVIHLSWGVVETWNEAMELLSSLRTQLEPVPYA